jgi:hypothetical protein
LKGYQVPKIRIHLFAPSILELPEEGITHTSSGLAYLQSWALFLVKVIGLYNQNSIRLSGAFCQ